jgi:hypothetical protein
VSEKTYLGDSVYVEFDGNGLWLTTNNGYPDDPRNKIYLEPEVYFGLESYVKRLGGKSDVESDRRGTGEGRLAEGAEGKGGGPEIGGPELDL